MLGVIIGNNCIPDETLLALVTEKYEETNFIKNRKP